LAKKIGAESYITRKIFVLNVKECHHERNIKLVNHLKNE
jgi:hypothetical protein